MAATVKGTAHLFGVNGSVVNATVLSFTEGTSFNLEDETLDENGVGIEYRGDDRRADASIVIRIRSGYTVPAMGSDITFNSIKYFITGISRNETQRGFRELTLTLRNQEGITLT
jgi:hypothetical protein